MGASLVLPSFLAVLGTTVVLGACRAKDKESSLASFPDRTLTVAIKLKDGTCDVQTHVTYAEPLNCLTAGADTQGSIDGVVVPTARGGSVGESVVDSKCKVPGFHVIDKTLHSPKPTTTIKIADASTTLLAEIEGALVAPKLAKVPPSTELRRGNDFVLEWAPAAESLDDAELLWSADDGKGASKETCRDLAVAKPGEDADAAPRATIAANRIRFTVPKDLPPACSGKGTIRVRGRWHPKVTRCEGARCVATRETAATLKLTLAR